MRVIGFVCMAFCITASVTVQTRDVHAYCAEDVQKPGFLQCLREAFTLRLLASDRSYLATTIAVFLIEFAVFIPLTYLSSAAINTGSGLSPDKAYRLIAFLNVGSVPGRALPGYVADRMGRFNVMIMTAVVCMILIFCIWMPLTALREANESALTAFAVLFGFWCGAAISLTPVCIAQVSKVEEVGKRVGTTFSIASIGALVGVPIGGAIIDSDNGDYLGLVIFAGGLYTVAMAASSSAVVFLARGRFVRSIDCCVVGAACRPTEHCITIASRDQSTVSRVAITLRLRGKLCAFAAQA